MGARECFEVAGQAAGLLEEMGFVAVARLKGGVVTLEFWRGEQAMRYEFTDPSVTPRSLALACAAEYRERVGDD
ncbi:MAG TPA: hypothetical protein VFS43_41630 [Polyangiaceae bacterium]|nr:hypothetical protein [Polyangiaceae bacterium]